MERAREALAIDWPELPGSQAPANLPGSQAPAWEPLLPACASANTVELGTHSVAGNTTSCGRDGRPPQAIGNRAMQAKRVSTVSAVAGGILGEGGAAAVVGSRMIRRASRRDLSGIIRRASRRDFGGGRSRCCSGKPNDPPGKPAGFKWNDPPGGNTVGPRTAGRSGLACGGRSPSRPAVERFNIRKTRARRRRSWPAPRIAGLFACRRPSADDFDWSAR